MDGACAGLMGGGKDRVDVQIAFGRGGGADADGMVGLGHERRVAIGLGIDRDTFQAQLCAAPLNPARNLATIGNQDAGEAHFTRHEGTLLLRKLLIPSMPSSVSQASASRSGV